MKEVFVVENFQMTFTYTTQGIYASIFKMSIFPFRINAYLIFMLVPQWQPSWILIIFLRILPLNAVSIYRSHNKLFVLHILYQISMITYRLPKVNSTFNINFKITNLVKLKYFHVSEFYSFILIQMWQVHKLHVKLTGKIIFPVSFKDNFINHSM